MYIPSTFFGTQGSCITATTATTSGTGSVTTGSFISGGFYWQYYQFNNTAITEETNPANYNANFTIASGSTSQAKLFLVAGGGAGGLGKETICIVSGEPTAGGGGGGGGIVYYDNFTLAPGTYQISVGVGGGSPARPGRQGGNTTFNYTTAYTPFTSSLITAYGGGYGGWVEHYKCNQFDTTTLYQGNSGGSAGGNVNSSGTGLNVQTQPCCNGLGGLNGANQGFAGGYGYNFGNTTNGSGGGGAGGEGQAVDQTFQSSPGYGGTGQSWVVNGTSYTYAAGGGAVRAQGFPIINQSSADGNGTAGIGNGGHGSSDYYGGATQGTSGTVIIAWPICASTFSCKTFNITGSTSGISYLPCTLPYVTQSRASSPTDYFSACLLTFSGSNVPILLEGETTASVGGECGNQFTQSFDCNCTFVQAIAGSGTQTLTYFPCNGSGSITSSVTTAGKNICVEYGSNVSLTGIGSAINYYGGCTTGSVCTGVQYTSSIVNCSSMLATAGGGGATLTYLPCGASASVALTLSGSESMSICAGLTSSFLALTGGGSTLQTLGACSASIDLPYSIIQNCSSSVTASALFSGKYYPSTGFTFISNTTGTGSCWNVIGTASIAAAATYTNLVTQSSFTDCATCETSLIPFGRVSWSFSENSQDGLFTIYDNANTITTLSGSGTGNTTITAQHYVTASLTPVNYPITGAIVMNIYANGNSVTQSIGSSGNTAITSSFLVPSGSRTSITASITYYPNGLTGMKSYVFLAGPSGGTATYRLAGQTTDTSTTLSSGSSIQVCAFTNSVSITGIDSKQFAGPVCGNVFTASCDCYSASFTAGILPPYAVQYIPCSSSVFTYVLLDYPQTFSACISYPSSSLATAGQSGNPTSSLSLSGSCTSGNCP